MTVPPAIACNIGAFSIAERMRYNVLLRGIKSAVRRQWDLPDGYTWEMSGENLALRDAAEWVAMERRCCPFLTLRLEAGATDSSYRIHLRGPAGAKAFLVSEFGIVTGGL